jgi:Tfp pilus assembly protein PilO
MEIKNRQKVLLIAAVACVVALVGNSLVLDPLLKSWQSRSARIADLKKQVAEGEILMDHEQAIRRRWENMRTNTLPANTSQAGTEFFNTFDRCARNSGVTVVSFTPQWKQNQDDDYTTYECRADITGNIDTLSRFIYELEKEPLALKVESMEITSHDDKGQQLSLGLQISGLLLASTTTQP